MGERALLRLLLDEHLSPAIVEHLRRRNPEIALLSLQEWENGAYLRAEDALLLAAAHRQRLTLVTYDQRTIVPLLKSWGEQDIEHGGVILVDARTLAASDIGGLVTALDSLWWSLGQLDWTNRVVYLTARRAAG